MKKLFLALTLLTAIPVQAYNFKDVAQVAKDAGRLGWAAGMTCIGFGFLGAAVNFPEHAYYAYNAFSKNQPYAIGGSEGFIFYPDHSFTLAKGDYKANSLAAPIIVGTVATAAFAYLAYRSFKSAYNSIKSIGTNIDKAALSTAIKADLYKVFTQEMWIASKDFSAMAQGNIELENDLKDLYASFNVSEEAAQKKLNELCEKWDLEKIQI